MMSEWIKCLDEMPNENERVLVWDGNIIDIAFRKHDEVWNNCEGVTHWMPFPYPPKPRKTKSKEEE